MLERVLGIILPVFLIVAVGYGYARRHKADLTWLNRINVTVLAPALIFTALSGKDFDLAQNGLLMLGTVAVVLGSGLLGWPFAKLLQVNPRMLVPPVMFNNCGNIGLPLAALAFGPAGLSAMVAAFTVSNLLHFTVGIWLVDHHAKLGGVLKSPMVIATFIGFAFSILHPPLPEWLVLALKMIGDAMIPLMLLSLGVRLADSSWSEWRIGAIGGLLCPLTGLAIAGLLTPLLGLGPMHEGLLIIFGSLPPAVFNFMVAEQYRMEPGKVASIVLVGNLMALFFVPVGVTLALRA